MVKLHGPAIPKAAVAAAQKYPDADATTLAAKLQELHKQNTWNPEQVAKWAGRPLTGNGRVPHVPAGQPRENMTMGTPLQRRPTATLPEMLLALIGVLGYEGTEHVVHGMLEDIARDMESVS